MSLGLADELHVMEDVSRRTSGYFDKQMNEFALDLDVRPELLTVANVSYDLQIARFGCTTMALPSEGGPILARNLDWFPTKELAEASYVFEDERTITAGWFGAVGVVSGMAKRPNSDAFAVAINMVCSDEPSPKHGYPVLLFLRYVLERARNYAEALSMLTIQPLMAPCLITIVGCENDDRAVIERTPCKAEVRHEPGVLVATNHYRGRRNEEGDDEVLNTSCSRYEAAMNTYKAQHEGWPLTDAGLLKFLNTKVRMGLTAQHVVMRPRQQSMTLCVPK